MDERAAAASFATRISRLISGTAARAVQVASEATRARLAYRASVSSCAPPMYADCNNSGSDGCEVFLQTDVHNCGACATRLPRHTVRRRSVRARHHREHRRFGKRARARFHVCLRLDRAKHRDVAAVGWKHAVGVRTKRGVSSSALVRRAASLRGARQRFRSNGDRRTQQKRAEQSHA